MAHSYLTLWCLYMLHCALQAMFGELNMQVVVLTLLYSWAGLGIAIVNDFKSVSHAACN
jgi:succinate-acetate transporter protein